MFSKFSNDVQRTTQPTLNKKVKPLTLTPFADDKIKPIIFFFKIESSIDSRNYFSYSFSYLKLDARNRSLKLFMGHIQYYATFSPNFGPSLFP